MKKLILFLLILVSVLGCENDPITFPDYDYSSVYFPYQFPVRTITLGEDIYDNTLDLQYKCNIMATMSGVYENKKDITIDFIVADTIPKDYKFVGTNPLRPVLPLPRDYYTLASNQILIKKGAVSGGVEVQLTDKFFEDPLTTQNNYVIPLILTTAVGVDSILQGKPTIPNSKPRRLNSRMWEIASKDFVLYGVKYINTWHGFYLRRGVDVITGNVNRTIVRRPKDVQTYDAASTPVSNWLVQLTTGTLKVLKFPVLLQDAGGSNFTCTLNLTFDDAGKCVVTSSDPTAFTASGTGAFVKKGEKNSFGNLDRDVLYLDYTINHTVRNIMTQTKDTLLMRNRGVVMETFKVIR